MAEFIFDLQRFDGDGGGSSGSSSGSSGGTGASSGGSNAKTDGDTTVAASEIWKDGWKAYSTKDRSAYAATAYAMLQTVAPTEYVATANADVINVSGLVNNVIYNVDGSDNIRFTDLYLESFAAFYNYTEDNNYVDLIFSSGTVTRLYMADSDLTLGNARFTPTLTFASGLSEAYSLDLKTWFGSEELVTATGYWNTGGILDYYARYFSTQGVDDNLAEILPVSRTVNTFVSAGDQDNVWLCDVSSLAEIAVKEGTASKVPTVNADGTVTNTQSNALNLVFSNGTAALIYYTDNDLLPTRDYSPTFYLADGSAYVYNSELGWRTYEQATADATQAAQDELQAAADKAAFDANFNAVYDTRAEAVNAAGKTYNPWDARSTFPASRWYSTMIYNTYSTNDIVFDDALPSNIVSTIQEDDSNFDIVFDTGAVTRINYLEVVSPVIHFADGTAYAYNYATKEFVGTQSGLWKNEDGSVSYDIAEDVALAESDDLAVSYDDNGFDGDGGYIKGGGVYSDVIDDKQEPDTNPTDTQNRDAVPFETANKAVGYEPLHDDLIVSRGTNNFINKVTANDDIWLLDTALENITDINITSNYAISMDFDTGNNLRVQDSSRISPVFHLADGTVAAYNWFADKWVVGVTEATAGVADPFVVSRYADNFIRNTEASDIVYIPDALLGNVARFDEKSYYINLTFDTGATVAVRYTDLQSPTFVFADGQIYTYTWKGDEDIYNGDDLDSEAETFSFSRFRNGTVYNAGKGDSVTFADATVANVTDVSTDTNNIVFTFDTGNTATISNYLDNYWPRIYFADGTVFAYDYYSGVLGTPYAADQNVTEGIPLSGLVNNVIYNTSSEDTVAFDVPSSNVVAYEIRNDNDILLTFDTGAQTAIQFWGNYSPTIQFADGNQLVYKFEDTENGLGNPANWTNGMYYYTGTDGTEKILLSKDTDSYVTYADEDDIIVFTDATYGNVVKVNADYYQVTVTFDTGKTATVEYLDRFSPIFVFADNTAYTYDYWGRWYTDYMAHVASGDPSEPETIQLDTTVNNMVYFTGPQDTVQFVNAYSAGYEYSGTTSRLGGYYGYEFYNAETGYTESVIRYNPGGAYALPNIVWGDGSASTQYHELDGTITLSAAGNGVVDYINDAYDNENIIIADAAKSDLSSVDINDYMEVTLNFNTGKQIVIDCFNDLSPMISFSDGDIGVDVYGGYWGSAYDAAALNGTVTVDRNGNHIIYNGDSLKQITVNDTTSDDYGTYTWSTSHPYYRFNFNEDTDAESHTVVSYGDATDFTLSLVKGDDTSTYTYTGKDATYQVAETADLNIHKVNVICHGGQEDTVTFYDGSGTDATKLKVEDVESVNVTTSRVRFTFNDGRPSMIGYYTSSGSPEFNFEDGSYRYNTSSSTWESKDSLGNWSAVESPFAATSSDLWGDTFTGTAEADNFFVGTQTNTVVDNVDSQDSVTFDATLSDIVFTSVDAGTITVDFVTGATAVIQTTGDSPTFNLASGESFTYDRQASAWKTA